MEETDKRKAKILFLFIIITLGFIVFLGTLFYWAKIDRRLPRLTHKEVIHATRGNIISGDGFKVATSKKLYKATVDTRNIDIDRLNLFTKLYSIYSGDSQKKINDIILSHKGSVVLSYQINPKNAKYLKSLAKKFFKLGILKSYTDPSNGITFLHGLNIIESGESRYFPAKNTLEPILGYVKKIEKNNITKVIGVKGIEGYYEDKLESIQDSLVAGKRDIANNIILSRDSISTPRIDGIDIHITINLKLQKVIENVLDKYKNDLNASEIVVGVMHSKTGAILSLATSNRFNPNSIKRADYKNLNVTAVEFEYEPGSVMKSITFALLLKEKKVNPYDLVPIFGGKYKLGRRTIRDAHAYDWLSAEDVIVHSSNVGIAQLAQKLDPVEFYQGLRDFGFSFKTKVDIPYETYGYIPSIHKLKAETYKATVGYGYGMSATFMQVLKAYNAFNNNGRLVTPYIASYFESQDGKKYDIQRDGEKEVIPVSVAKRMQKILIKTVQEGTGVATKIEGLSIGGKTGTAQIVENRHYVRKYNSSFFGFANDVTNKFTIGVLVRRPLKRYTYYASQTAVPIFKSVVQRLVEEGYLTPKKLSPK